jgi:N-acetylglutamate synthase-like GNAT family acetyltransferase
LLHWLRPTGIIQLYLPAAFPRYPFLQASIHIVSPDEEDFILIKEYISRFELDGRDLSQEQFLMARNADGLLGFGRIKTHEGCDEYCTLGVIENLRSKGVGKAICNAIIGASKQPLYLVCIIPEYFIPLGFKVVSEYPLQLLDKLNYCTSSLAVPEEYVVMRFFQN